MKNLETIKQNLYNGQSVSSIDDPVQTHAIYGLASSSDVYRLKMTLKEEKLANRFRQIKNHFGNYILCFKIKQDA